MSMSSATPIHATRRLRVIIIGAGPSGLLMAYKLRRNFIDLDIVMYEKNADVGGTWFENKYPGCRCDIPAHIYVWSFEQKADFPETYATSDQISGYFQTFHGKHGLDQVTRTRCEVKGAHWSSEDSLWNVRVYDELAGREIHDFCQVLINASGFLNSPALPKIPGLETFRGRVVHTAAWPDQLALDGKKVVVLGNGSSGVQVVPAIVGRVLSLTCVMRSPVWVAGLGSSFREYSPDEIRRFENNPEHLKLLRKWLEHTGNQAFPMFMAGSQKQTETREKLASYMEQSLAEHPNLQGLIPSWPVGCRRLSPAHGFLEALTDPKATVIFRGIDSITPDGIVVGEEEIKADVIVCATGFDTSFRPRFDIVSGARDLASVWKSEPACYLGMAVSHFPNYFTLLGPNSPLGNGPVLICIEAQADYICKVITRIQTEGIDSISVKEEAVKDFLAYKDRFMKQTVCAQECRSWYKNHTHDGKVFGLWPGSTLHYLETIQDVRFEDYDVRYLGNRFDYLGDGISRLEACEDADLAPYIRLSDDGPIWGSRFEYARKPAGF